MKLWPTLRRAKKKKENISKKEESTKEDNSNYRKDNVFNPYTDLPDIIDEIYTAYPGPEYVASDRITFIEVFEEEPDIKRPKDFIILEGSSLDKYMQAVGSKTKMEKITIDGRGKNVEGDTFLMTNQILLFDKEQQEVKLDNPKFSFLSELLEEVPEELLDRILPVESLIGEIVITYGSQDITDLFGLHPQKSAYPDSTEHLENAGFVANLKLETPDGSLEKIRSVAQEIKRIKEEGAHKDTDRLTKIMEKVKPFNDLYGSVKEMDSLENSISIALSSFKFSDSGFDAYAFKDSVIVFGKNVQDYNKVKVINGDENPEEVVDFLSKLGYISINKDKEKLIGLTSNKPIVEEVLKKISSAGYTYEKISPKITIFDNAPSEQKTPDEWVKYWNTVRDKRFSPSIADLYSILKFMSEHLDSNEEVLQTLRKDLDDYKWILTSTRVQRNPDNGLAKIIHNYGSDLEKSPIEVEVPAQAQLFSNFLSQPKGLDYLRAFLGTEDNSEKIIKVFETINPQPNYQIMIFPSFSNSEENSEKVIEEGVALRKGSNGPLIIDFGAWLTAYYFSCGVREVDYVKKMVSKEEAK